MRQKQPSARNCFVCGVENQRGLKLAFYDIAPGKVETRLTVANDYQGFPGIAHGGILASILDETATRTVLGANGSRRIVVTASLEVRYRKPVPLNVPLRAVGEIIDDKGEIIRAVSRVESEDGVVLANATVVMVEAPSDLSIHSTLTPDDWKVYPDGD